MKKGININLKVRILSLLILGFALPMSGCAIHFGGGYSADDVDPKKKNLSIAYGYIDMGDASSELRWVKLYQYKPRRDDSLFGMTEDGVFWHMGLENKGYLLYSFGSKIGTFSGRVSSYRIHDEDEGAAGVRANPTSISIKKPGAYYMGAYRFKPAGNSFNFNSMRSVSEKEVLKKLLRIMQNDYRKYQYQIALLKIRLKQLGK